MRMTSTRTRRQWESSVTRDLRKLRCNKTESQGRSKQDKNEDECRWKLLETRCHYLLMKIMFLFCFWIFFLLKQSRRQGNYVFSSLDCWNDTTSFTCRIYTFYGIHKHTLNCTSEYRESRLKTLNFNFRDEGNFSYYICFCFLSIDLRI